VIETKNIPQLSSELELLQKENEILRGKLSTKESVIFDLRFQLDQLRRAIFGHKSERFVPENPDQLRLDFGMGEEAPVVPETETITYTRPKREKKASVPNVRLAIPAHLPRVIEIIEPENLPAGSKKIGEEKTEVLEITPARIYVRCIIRPKYALPQEKGISIAYLPSLPLPKSNAGASLIAWLIVNKYVNHLPFYRQVQILKRDGVDLAESTINNWFAKTADLLEPLYDRIWLHIRESDHIFADESTIKVLNTDKPSGSLKGYFWLFKTLDPGMVLFYYNKGSRGYHILHEVLPGFQGAVQCDGYGAYDDLDKIKGITTIGCWAHARRKFEQALENDPVPARYAMLKIQELYAIERKATEGNFTPDQIKELREKESYPILKEFETWLLATAQTVLPKSPIGKAIHYTYGIYRKLIRYTLDGRYRIDNNLAENSVRDLALGRKNYLFCGNHESARRTAVIYSLMASCKVNDVNPQEWLTDVLNRIQDQKNQKMDELLPHIWKLNRA
jgi:transposase